MNKNENLGLGFIETSIGQKLAGNTGFGSRCSTVCRTAILLAVTILGMFENDLANGQITLQADFESASLDVDNSAVDGTNIELVGVQSWTATSLLGPVYFKASGVNDVQPTFSIQRSNNWAFLSQHPFFYSYDQQNWTSFDQSFNEGAFRRFKNNKPFTQEDVYVAWVVPYPESRTSDMMSIWADSPYAAPTLSANANFMLGTVANTTPYGPAELPVYAMRITDELSSFAKKSIVLLCGNHSGESPGNWALEGTVQFLLSDDPSAVQLRNRAEIIVYPQVDPLGRTEGYFRGNSQNPAIDHNRAWDADTNPTFSGFTEIALVHAAIHADTADFEQIEICIDYHSSRGEWPCTILGEAMYKSSPFVSTLQDLEPEMDFFAFEDLGVNLSDTSLFEFDVVQRYAAEIRPEEATEHSLRVGENYAIAMLAGIVTPGDVNVDGSVDLLDVSPFVNILSSGGYQIEADINRDEVVNLLDVGPFVDLLSN